MTLVLPIKYLGKIEAFSFYLKAYFHRMLCCQLNLMAILYKVILQFLNFCSEAQFNGRTKVNILRINVTKTIVRYIIWSTSCSITCVLSLKLPYILAYKMTEHNSQPTQFKTKVYLNLYQQHKNQNIYPHSKKKKVRAAIISHQYCQIAVIQYRLLQKTC